MPVPSLAAAALLMSFAIHGNRVELKLNQGAAEMVWVSPSMFRLRHSLDQPLTPAETPQKEEVEIHAVETPGAVTFSSKILTVTVRKRGLLVEVKNSSGRVLLSDVTEAKPLDGGGVAWEQAAPAGDRYYGLGPSTAPGFDLRGQRLRGSPPWLYTTAGYAEIHNSTGMHTFDVAAGIVDRLHVEAPAVDYYLVFGPAPKEVFDEASALRTVLQPTPLVGIGAGSWDSLRDSVLRFVHASMSGVLMPAFDATAYRGAPEPLAARAAQFAQVCAALLPESEPGPPFRRQLKTFFATYGDEARERGFPFFHPLPFQFPEDTEAASHADEFLLGDEMLIAPITSPAGSRDVYLPRGRWTSFETGEVFPGRRTIHVSSTGLPMFARNGTIMPLDGLTSDEPMQLHYFPSLGAEFFLLETELSDWSQVHAAPAADIMRLEIESKVARRYEWIVHHAQKPLRVEFESDRYAEVGSHEVLRDRTWYYDAVTKSLHVRLQVDAGADAIVNLILPEPIDN